MNEKVLISLQILASTDPHTHTHVLRMIIPKRDCENKHEVISNFCAHQHRRVGV